MVDEQGLARLLTGLRQLRVMAEHINQKFGVEVQLIHREQNMEKLFNSKE